MNQQNMNWREQLRQRGFALFPGLTPESLINEALEAIDRDRVENSDPARQAEYDDRSYCPDIRSTAPIMNLLSQSPAHGILDDIFGLENIGWSEGQIAIRRAHNCPEPLPPTPHIDGFSAGLNGLEKGRIYNHTILVGVFLTPVTKEFAGNFTVWPQSHYVYEKYFQERGPEAMSEPMPLLEVGRPSQLLSGVGDVVLAHYQLAHAAAVNTSDVDRIAIYFRVWLHKMESDRWRYLTNMWNGWRL